MQPTSRLRVLFDRIPRVLVFVYFCRGLSENTEEWPTCHDYIEILKPAVIFRKLLDQRSNWAEPEGKRSPAQGARPRAWGARPALAANHSKSRGLCSTDLKD